MYSGGVNGSESHGAYSQVSRNESAHGEDEQNEVADISGGSGTSEQHTMSSCITMKPSYAPL